MLAPDQKFAAGQIAQLQNFDNSNKAQIRIPYEMFTILGFYLVSLSFTQQHIAELVVHLKFSKESGQVIGHFKATFAAICSTTPLKIACGL